MPKPPSTQTTTHTTTTTTTSASALSATEVASAVALNPTDVTAGTTAEISFAGGSIWGSNEFTGTPDAVLPLALTIGDNGLVVLPDDDAIYDLSLAVPLAPNAADAGKLIGVGVTNTWTNEASWSWVPAPVGGGFITGTVLAMFPIYRGSGAVTLLVHVDASHLANNVQVAGPSLRAVKR